MSQKHKASFSHTVLGMSVVQPPCQFLFMACQYVFPACPAEMLSAPMIKTGRFSSYQVRLIMSRTDLLTFKFDQLVLLARLVVLNHNSPRSFSRQDIGTTVA